MWFPQATFDNVPTDLNPASRRQTYDPAEMQGSNRLVREFTVISKRKNAAIIFLVALFAFASPGVSQLRLPFRKNSSGDQESSASSNRQLTIKDGPWLIMCSSFTGEDAEQLARQLANELHQHRLKTYIYRHDFDYSGTTAGLGWERPDAEGNFRPRQMKSANLEKVREVAVLVGDFGSVDDGRGQKILEQIKSMPITTIPQFVSTPNADVDENNDGNTWGRNSPIVPPTGGPLRTAFMLPNPLLPEEYFRHEKIDDFIIKLNRKPEYSLLDCPGLYSVKIASFRGESTIDPTKISNGESQFQALQRTGKSLTSSRLADATEKAHSITEALRKKGVEAYEFHDRHESYVCIGSFDWVTRQANGTALNNPDIVRIVNKCKPEIRSVPGNPNAILPKSINGIPLDPDPTPILVPKADGNRTAGRLSFLR